MHIALMILTHSPVHNACLWQAAYLYAPARCGEQLVDHIKLLQVLQDR